MQRHTSPAGLNNSTRQARMKSPGPLALSLRMGSFLLTIVPLSCGLLFLSASAIFLPETLFGNARDEIRRQGFEFDYVDAVLQNRRGQLLPSFVATDMQLAFARYGLRADKVTFRYRLQPLGWRWHVTLHVDRMVATMEPCLTNCGTGAQNSEKADSGIDAMAALPDMQPAALDKLFVQIHSFMRSYDRLGAEFILKVDRLILAAPYAGARTTLFKQIELRAGKDRMELRAPGVNLALMHGFRGDRLRMQAEARIDLPEKQTLGGLALTEQKKSELRGEAQLVLNADGAPLAGEARLEVNADSTTIVTPQAISVLLENVRSRIDLRLKPDNRREMMAVWRIDSSHMRWGGDATLYLPPDSESPLKMEAKGEALWLDVPSLWDAPLKVETQIVNVSWRGIETIEAEIEEIALADIVLSGRLEASRDHVDASWALDTAISARGSLDAGTVLALWPKNIEGATRDWMLGAVQRMRMSGIGFSMQKRAAATEFELLLSASDGLVRFAEGFPPIEVHESSLRMIPGKLFVTMQSGAMAGMRINRSTIRFPRHDVYGSEVLYDVDMTGSVPAVLRFLQGTPMVKQEDIGFTPQQMDGDFKARFAFTSFNKLDVAPEEILFSGTVDAQLASVRKFPLLDADIRDIGARISFSNDYLWVEGNTDWNNAGIVFRYEPVYGKQERYSIRLSGKVNPALGDDLNLPLRLFLRGSTGFGLAMYGKDLLRPESIRLSVNTNELSLFLDDLFWKPDADDPVWMFLDVDASDTKEQPTGVPPDDYRFVLHSEGGDLGLRGQGDFSVTNAQADLVVYRDGPDAKTLRIGVQASPEGLSFSGVLPYVNGKKVLSYAQKLFANDAQPASFDGNIRLDLFMTLLRGEKDHFWHDAHLEFASGAQADGKIDFSAYTSASLAQAEQAEEATKSEREVPERGVLHLSGLLGDAGLSSLRYYSNDLGGSISWFTGNDYIIGGEGLLSLEEEQGALIGSLTGTGALVRDMPFFTKLFLSASLSGLENLLADSGIGFSNYSGDLVIWGDAVHFTNMYAEGEALGLTMSGIYDMRSLSLDSAGVMTPAYGLTNILKVVPLFGQLFTPGKGRGLISVTYGVQGNLEEGLTIWTNPASLLLPGAWKRVLDRGHAMTPEAYRSRFSE